MSRVERDMQADLSASFKITSNVFYLLGARSVASWLRRAGCGL